MVAMIFLTSSAKAAVDQLNARRSRTRGRSSARRSVVFIVISLLLLVIPAGVSAQEKPDIPGLLDKSLEELMSIEIESVSSASGFTQKVTEVHASVTFVTSEDIQRYGYRTLAEVLKSVPGFYVSYDRNYSYVGVMGYGLPGDYNSRIALLIDGHRMNDNIYEGALLGTDFPLDVDLIDCVEVIRGPNSSLYLASAFLGVINVITKKGGTYGR
jgi:outer membrane receptor for ferrienterochelin and colicin